MRAVRGLVLGLLLAAAARGAAAQPLPPAPDPGRAALQRRATALIQQAIRLHGQGQLARAIPLAKQAAALARRLYPPEDFPDGHPELAGSLNTLGFLFQAGGDLVQAEVYFRQALAVNRRLYPPRRFPHGHRDLAASVNNVGAALWARGAYAQAEPLLREALALRQELYPPDRFPQGHADLVLSLNNLGALLQARGEYAQAESLWRRALAMAQKLYPPGRTPRGHPALALSLHNLGLVLQARGQSAEAERCLRRALAIREKLYPAGRFPKGQPDLAASLISLGFLLWDRGEYAEAEPVMRRALAMAQKLYPPDRFPEGHPDLSAGLHNLATLLQDRGDLAFAEVYHRQALAMRERLYPPEHYPQGHPQLIATLNNLGSLPLARGEFAQAEPYLRKALALQQRQFQALLTGSSEAQVLNHLAQVPTTRDGYLSATRARPEKDAAAYEVVWQAKAGVARWLSQRRLAGLASADPRSREAARQLAHKRRLLAALLLSRGPLRAEQARRVRELGEEKEQLEKTLAGALPAFDRALKAARSTPQDLGEHLPEGAAYVDLLRYIHVEHDPGRPGRQGEHGTFNYVAFVFGRQGAARRVELGSADLIDRALADWRAALTGGPDPHRTTRPPARPGRGAAPEVELRRWLWEPLARHLPPGTRAVYLAPDAALTGLPWGALPGSKSGTVLLEEHAVAVVPHGPFLLAALTDDHRPRQAEGRLLAVGGVAYGRAPAVARPASAGRSVRREPELSVPAGLGPAPRGRPRWPGLEGTRREVQRLRALAGKRDVLLRTGAEAGTDQLLADLPKARWAHLATHGFFADEKVRPALQLGERDYERGRRGEKVGVGARSPLALSGLVLAGANLEGEGAPPDRGILTAEAIAGLDLDGLDLAVLSACDTGLGEVAGGEGVFGLQRAFHIAGCRDVVASLWQVDDEATAALMGLFYHGLWAEKLPPLEALRRAQLTMYRHPERIPALARDRGPDFDRVARRPAEARAGARAPARLWAGFVLSGPGR
jgi:CHAT domain-containing protein/Tfp pilus assembly protein PilF